MITFNSDSNLCAVCGFVHWKWRPAWPKVTEQPAEVTDDRGRSRLYFSLRPKLRENTGKGQWGWLFQRPKYSKWVRIQVTPRLQMRPRGSVLSRDHGGQSLWVPDAPLPTRTEHPARGITFTSPTPATSVTSNGRLLSRMTAFSTLHGGISRPSRPLVQAPQVSSYPDGCGARGQGGRAAPLGDPVRER